MIVYTTYTPEYEQLSEVLRSSVHEHTPGVPFVMAPLRDWEHIGPDDVTGGYIQHLRQSAEFVSAMDDDVAVLDADMYCRGNLQPIFDVSADVAVTVRDDEQRYNAGAVFVRDTPEAAAFMQQWLMVAEAFCAGADSGESHRKAWGSVDQAALAWLLRSGRNEAHVTEVPCQRWNACQQNWPDIDDATRLVHVKGRLRDACLNGAEHHDLAYIVDEWRRYCD